MMIPAFIRNPVIALARSTGYEIRKVGREGTPYEISFPQATYAPWNLDAPFKEIYSAINTHTLVDIYRCYELWSLIQMVAHLEGCFLEVGVWRGGTGALIAKRALLSGISDTVYLCDTFEGVVKASDDDPMYAGGEHADTSPEVVDALLKDLELPNARILRGIFPDDTSSSIEETAFRFCHVDVDVYQSAKDIVEWVWQRLVVGGIVVFDDYGFETTPGVTRYVDELKPLHDRVIVHNLNGHAIAVRTR
jgi:O-methyltransferase